MSGITRFPSRIRGFIEEQWFRKPPAKEDVVRTPAELRVMAQAKEAAELHVALMEKVAAARRVKGDHAKYACVVKTARRLFRGKGTDGSWRLWPKEPPVKYADGKVAL